MKRVKSIQSVHDRRDGGWITRGFLQRQHVNRLCRIAAQNLFADAFEDTTGLNIICVIVRCDQSRQRRCRAIDVRFDVISDNPQRSRLRRNNLDAPQSNKMAAQPDKKCLMIW
ncbi:MAG: hypothetical protein WDM76_12975 [Limisphaerales bacterium]